MKKLSVLSATLLSSALILSACSSTSEKKEETNKQTATSSSNENKAIQAYDFTAMDKDGKTVKLSDFKGKKVYINMWASWCGPCMREIPELEKTYQKLKDNKEIVFLSMTSPNEAVVNIEKNRISYAKFFCFVKDYLFTFILRTLVFEFCIIRRSH